MNAALAVAMLRHQTILAMPERALIAAMRWADWPARLQKLAAGPLVGEREVWLDGGHNANAAQVLARAMREKSPFTMIAGSLKTKDPRGLLAPFREFASSVLTVPIPDHECFSPEELVAVASSLGMKAQPFASVEEALNAASQDEPTLIAGSLYLAGEVLRLNGQAPD